MSVTLKADLPRFLAALRSKIKLSARGEAEVINKSLRNVAFRAASFTDKATARDVTSDLKRDNILLKLAIRYCRRKYGTGKGAWGNKKEAKAKIREAMALILKKRKRGIGALRAGWIPSIQQLGRSYRGAKVNAGGTASLGSAKKADAESLTGAITNAVQVWSANNVQFSAADVAMAVNALDRAIEFVTDDMEGYLARKVMEAWDAE